MGHVTVCGASHTSMCVTQNDVILSKLGCMKTRSSDRSVAAVNGKWPYIALY